MTGYNRTGLRNAIAVKMGTNDLTEFLDLCERTWVNQGHNVNLLKQAIHRYLQNGRGVHRTDLMFANELAEIVAGYFNGDRV